MKIIGLVGGIGSGKSTVAKLIAKRDDVAVIDADQLGHDVLLLGEVKQQIRACWGDLPFDGNGEIDRRKMAAIVFAGTEESNNNLKRLIDISHPKIGELLQQQINDAKTSGMRLVLIDAPLLLEGKWDQYCDEIIFVDSPEDERIKRVMTRGWTLVEYHARVANQYPLEKKQHSAKYVLQNTGTVSQLEKNIDQLIQKILD